MAQITLDCGHPGLVTHERGDRLVACAVPNCRGQNVVTAHATLDVVYEVRRAPGHQQLATGAAS